MYRLNRIGSNKKSNELYICYIYVQYVVYAHTHKLNTYLCTKIYMRKSSLLVTRQVPYTAISLVECGEK
jgi:hypothetical protein